MVRVGLEALWPSDIGVFAMSKLPSMPLYVDAFLADTMHLTCEESGAYMLLLMSMWRHNGSVPDDDKDNARITRLSVRKWKAVKQRLAPMLSVENGELTQKRLKKEWSKAENFAQKQSQNARKKWMGEPKKNNNLADATAQSGISQTDAPISISISNKESDLRSVVNTKRVDMPDLPKCLDRRKSKPLPVKKAFENYNTAAGELGLPIAEKLTPERQRKLRARLSEHGLEGWNRALVQIENSEFLRGGGAKGWRAGLDFLLQPSSFNKVLEGGYADHE